jgi:gliding motility-associated-like protein
LPVSIIAQDTVCLNVPIEFTATGDSAYKRFNWSFGDGSSASHPRPDTMASHAYTVAGLQEVRLTPTVTNGYECVDTATKKIFVNSIEAAFDIDSSETPAFTFNNASQLAVRAFWDFGFPEKGEKNQSSLWDGRFDYGEDTGTFIVCLTVFNADDCEDSICKPIILSRRDEWVIIPNVFTPDNNDNKNDAFDIDIFGFTKYELQIYNRWGTEVYLSGKDGIGNDGTNWNGKDHNVGLPCAEGTYFFIFNYQLYSYPNPKTVHGTITLIRDK